MALNEANSELSLFTNDPDRAKAALARMINDGLTSWIQLYGELPNGNQIKDIAQAIEEWKQAKVLTPEIVTNYWRAKLAKDGARIGLDIAVPDCDWSTEQIAEPMIDAHGRETSTLMIYHPKQLVGKVGQGLMRLGQIYPELQCELLELDTSINETHETSGWLKVQVGNGVPHSCNKTPNQIIDHAQALGYKDLRLSTYVLADQLNKDINGRHLDGALVKKSGPYSYFYGTYITGTKHPLEMNFQADGTLDYRFTNRTSHLKYTGGGFEQTKPI